LRCPAAKGPKAEATLALQRVPGPLCQGHPEGLPGTGTPVRAGPRPRAAPGQHPLPPAWGALGGLGAGRGGDGEKDLESVLKVKKEEEGGRRKKKEEDDMIRYIVI